MKLFQLYPKALAHLTCKSPWGRVFSTKMGALGGVWKGCPAGLTRRARRTKGRLCRPGERRTENGACSAEGANLPRLQNARQAGAG